MHPHVSFSWNTALIPEEAESALEATRYFTEDSPSEGASPLSHLAPVAATGLQEASSTPTVGGSMPPCCAPWEGPAPLPGPCWPCRCSHPLSLLHLCLPGPGLLPLRIFCCPFQHLLWPQIWIFSCPGRHKVSPWRAGATPLPLGFVFFYSEAWKLPRPRDSLETSSCGDKS